MKKITVILMLWTIGAPVFAGPTSLQKIKERGSLKLAIYAQPTPPFFYKDSGQNWVGYDIEVAQYIASHLGVSLKINDQSKTFDETVYSVNTESADIAISKISINPKRAIKVWFSSPYLQLNVYKAYNRQSELKSKGKSTTLSTAGALKGSSFVAITKRLFPKAKIVEFSDRKQIYQSLEKGSINFTLVDKTSLDNWKHKYPSSNLKIATRKLDGVKDSLGIAIPYRDQELARYFESILLEMKNLGFSQKLKKKYFENDSWRSGSLL